MQGILAYSKIQLVHYSGTVRQ